VSEWISVKDRLPKPDNSGEPRYLIRVDGRSQYTWVDFWWKKPYSDDFWWVNLKDDEVVTHWMPLPEPPQETE